MVTGPAMWIFRPFIPLMCFTHLRNSKSVHRGYLDKHLWKCFIIAPSTQGRVNGVTPSTSAVPILDCCINNIIKHLFILLKCNWKEENLVIVSSVVSWIGPTAVMKRKSCWLLTIYLVQLAWKTLQQFMFMETARCTASVGLKGNGYCI